MSPVLSWRRKLETGEAATIQDIAKTEKVSTQFVIRLGAFLSGLKGKAAGAALQRSANF